MKSILAKQINESPEPLRMYIHDLETVMDWGNVAHLIQENFMLREQVKLLEFKMRRGNVSRIGADKSIS